MHGSNFCTNWHTTSSHLNWKSQIQISKMWVAEWNSEILALKNMRPVAKFRSKSEKSLSNENSQSSVTIESVWELPYLFTWIMASSTSSTISSAIWSPLYSFRIDVAGAGPNLRSEDRRGPACIFTFVKNIQWLSQCYKWLHTKRFRQLSPKLLKYTYNREPYQQEQYVDESSIVKNVWK